jgi:hypothetical protein
VRVAYIISAYRYPDQLLRLVDRLTADFAEFFVHVDKKAPDDVAAAMHAGLTQRRSVHLLHRHVCHYCGFGHVEASLEGIRKTLSAAVPFDYVVLLTGQDYPIKSNRYIRDFFSAANGKSFMHYVPLSEPTLSDVWPDALERLTHWRVQGKRRAYVLPPTDVYLRPIISPVSGPVGLVLKYFMPKRRPLPGFPPYGGSGYWNLSASCIRYVQEFAQSHPAFVRYFRYTGIPDEHFFQTMLLNSRFAKAWPMTH